MEYFRNHPIKFAANLIEVNLPSEVEFSDMYDNLNLMKFSEMDTLDVKNNLQIAFNSNNIKEATSYSIYSSSLNYWNFYEKSNTYLQLNRAIYYAYSNELQTSGRVPRECKVNWVSVAWSDAGGAYSGAAWGGFRGPAGVFAGALSMGVLSSGTAAAVAALSSCP